MNNQKEISFHLYNLLNDQLMLRKESLYYEIKSIKKISTNKRINFFIVSYFESTIKWIVDNLYNFFTFNINTNPFEPKDIVDYYGFFNSLRNNENVELVNFKEMKNFFLEKKLHNINFNNKKWIVRKRMISMLKNINNFIKGEKKNLDIINKWSEMAYSNRNEVAHGEDIFLENNLIATNKDLENKFMIIIESFFNLLIMWINKIYIYVTK